MRAAVGTALLGCGRISRLFHLPMLAALEGCVLRGVAEPDPHSRAAAARIVGDAVLVDDYESLLADDSVEAVVICLPSGLHAAAAEAAFAAGKHVYLEKPMATSLEEARGVREAWRSAGRHGMIGFNQRFDPLVRSARQAVAEGRLGETAGARIMLGSATRTPPAWKELRATGGGVLLDLGSHAADLARFVFGQEIASVSATIRSQRFEADTAALTMVLADGQIVQAHLTSTAAQESRFELLGEHGVLAVDRYAGTFEPRRPLPPYGASARAGHALRALRRAPLRARALVRPARDGDSYRAALGAFIGSIRADEPCPPDLEDGYRSLAVVIAAEESARLSRPVELEAASS